MKKGFFLEVYDDGKGGRYRPWGCMVKVSPQFPRNKIQGLGDEYANGLTCSRHVGWCLLNGEAVTDLDLLKRSYSKEYRDFPNTVAVNLKDNVDTIKPGDLIWFEGHIAIVIGVEDDTVIYSSAEGGKKHPGRGIRLAKFSKKNTNYDTFLYKMIIKMEKIYKEK